MPLTPDGNTYTLQETLVTHGWKDVPQSKKISYVGSTPNAPFTYNGIYAARLRVSPSGLHMIVSGLYGLVAIYRRSSPLSAWTLQTSSVINMALNYPSGWSERGMLSMFTDPHFTEYSQDVVKRQCYLTYQYYENEVFYQGVGKFTLSGSHVVPVVPSALSAWPAPSPPTTEVVNGWSTILLSNYKEVLMNNFVNIIPGDTYQVVFELKYSGDIDNVRYSFFTNNGHHVMPLTAALDMGGYYQCTVEYASSPSDLVVRLVDIIFETEDTGITLELRNINLINVSKNNWYGHDFSEIFTFDEQDSVSNPFGAHQITDGYINNDKIYVLQGDGFDEAKAQDMTSLKGKMLAMNLDGSDIQIVAKGLRNEFSLRQLPASTDMYERVVGIGNGHAIGRMFFSLIPSHGSGQVLNMGWGAQGDTNVEEDGNGWAGFSYTPDLNNPIVSPDGVLLMLEDDPSANGLALHIQDGRVLVFFSCWGKTYAKSWSDETMHQPQGYENMVWTAELINLGNQPSLINIQPMFEFDKSQDVIPCPSTLEWDRFAQKLMITDLNFYNEPSIVSASVADMSTLLPVREVANEQQAFLTALENYIFHTCKKLFPQLVQN